MNGTTIAAISTPRGSGGIGIVKISGPESLAIAAKIFRHNAPVSGRRPARPLADNAYQSHRLCYGIVVNPEDEIRIDEVLVATMLAPRSYTGEDVVEINAHASPVVLDLILDMVLKSGAKLAQPGEFTRRAFLNGRIDLTQAEAVSDLINAKTVGAAAMANALLSGRLRVAIESASEQLKQIIAHNEARIDFPEEVDDDASRQSEAQLIFNAIIQPLQEIADQYQTGRIYREGLRLAVVGRPNVGKSSLMNRLLKEEKVIVTDVPGTTRDSIEDLINLQGVPVVIVDTAGFQQTDNPVEIIGIKKTLQNIEKADLLLFVLEEGRALDHNDRAIYQQIKSKKMIVVVNKQDLNQNESVVQLPGSWLECPLVKTSAISGEGLAALEEEILQFVKGTGNAAAKKDFAPNIRQKNHLDKSLLAARASVESILRQDPEELTALDLQECLQGLDDILGNNLKEDILNRIFSEFCIGK